MPLRTYTTLRLYGHVKVRHKNLTILTPVTRCEDVHKYEGRNNPFGTQSRITIFLGLKQNTNMIWLLVIELPLFIFIDKYFYRRMAL